MTRGGMDPEGIGVYTVLKNLCIIERNKSEINRNIESVLACGLEPSGVHSPAVQIHPQGMPSPRSRQDQYESDHTRNIESVLARGLGTFRRSLSCRTDSSSRDDFAERQTRPVRGTIGGDTGHLDAY